MALWTNTRPAPPGWPGVPMLDAIGEQAARMFLCAGCRAQVVVCADCDRGQRYCAGGCSERTRQRLQHEAGGRYQRSPKGRHKHAQRMRRWRARRRAHANKVTHQGSPELDTGGVLAPSQTTTPICASPAASLPLMSLASPPMARTTLAPLSCRCHFCGAAVPSQLRRDFLRRRYHRADPEP